MRTGGQVSERHPNPILAGLYGAFGALVLGYAGSYFFTLLGAGIINHPGRQMEHGPATLMRAGLNLYAMLHTSLVGSGALRTPTGDLEQVSGHILLPLTVWALIPVIALIIGGYAAGKRRAGTGRWGVVIPAILGGVLYAGALALLAPLISARVDPTALPSVQGYEFNPPNIAFHPSTLSALYAGLLFGVCSMYLGGLLAARGERSREDPPGKWWACGKAVIIVALIVQILIAGALEVWFVTRPAAANDDGPVGSRFAQMLPTGAGIGYSVINGASLASGVETSAPGAELAMRPLWAKVNLYYGTTRDDDYGKKHTSLPPYVLALPAMLAVLMLVAGGFAVRWGSRDGAVPTALRMALLNTAYVAFLIWACRIEWSQTVRSAGFSGKSVVFVAPQFTLLMVAGFFGVALAALVGALIARRKYSAPVSYLEL